MTRDWDHMNDPQTPEQFDAWFARADAERVRDWIRRKGGDECDHLLFAYSAEKLKALL